ncbi:WD40 repeat-like protein [Sistotremastrum niveocremeum HHB9708]|uniref:WD40 repeat-like protein n=1 Tax=Sistotremastrum niveocremeum HHB9708 TaxID=1314777 RepID=A0A164QVF1_9AGAM|nr:WD40 repeat-like protein [Sistotremastrum niveocremeum HHB9708]
MPRKISTQDIMSALNAQNRKNSPYNIKPSGLGIDWLDEIEENISSQTISNKQALQAIRQLSQFESQINELDGHLRAFTSAARQLESSVAIISSALQLSTKTSGSRVCTLPAQFSGPPPKEGEKETNESSTFTDSFAEKVDQEQFPAELLGLSDDFLQFHKGLQEFPDFTDEAVSAAILNFCGDLRYWGTNLMDFKGQLRSPEVNQYIIALTPKIGLHIETLSSTILLFIESELPAIQRAQSRRASSLVNFSTVATFFSAVTASTLQVSATVNQSLLGDFVNTFWIASLIFSIAAVVNSLMGLSWSSKLYRSPRHKVPLLVRIWMPGNPLVLFLISVELFLIGLILFVHTSGQNAATSITTTVLAVCYSVALVSSSLWVVAERWTFFRYHGQKWLYDLFGQLSTGSAHVHEFPIPFVQVVRNYICSFTRGAGIADPESTIDTEDSDTLEHISINMTNTGSYQASMGIDLPEVRSATEPPQALDEKTSRPVVDIPATSSLDRNVVDSPREMPLGERVAQAMLSLAQNQRQLSLLPLRPDYSFKAHNQLIRALEFSFDGQFLATASWDRSTSIFNARTGVESQPISSRMVTGFCKQAIWSSSNERVLVRLSNSIWIHGRDGHMTMLERPRIVEAVGWLSNGDGPRILSSEGGRLRIIVSHVAQLDQPDHPPQDLTGKIVDTHKIERFSVYNFVVSPDSQRIFAIAKLMKSKEGLQPTQAPIEKRLIVYNLVSRVIESQTPVMESMEHIVMSKKGDCVILSSEGDAYPTLWRWLKVDGTWQLNFGRTYYPEQEAVWGTRAILTGKDDQLVATVDKTGQIHVWKRDSGTILQLLKDLEPLGTITSIAAKTLPAGHVVVVTGDSEGFVKCWTNTDS